jgi:Domain of unkown function (DUF1775)
MVFLSGAGGREDSMDRMTPAFLGVSISGLTLIGAFTIADVTGQPGPAHQKKTVIRPRSHQELTLHVPADTDGPANNELDLGLPIGFEADSCTASTGWTCSVGSTDEGPRITFTRLGQHESAVDRPTDWRERGLGPPKVVPRPAHAPSREGEDFQFAVKAPLSGGDYTFKIEQHYANGVEVNWDGPQTSQTPAPVLLVR